MTRACGSARAWMRSLASAWALAIVWSCAEAPAPQRADGDAGAQAVEVEATDALSADASVDGGAPGDGEGGGLEGDAGGAAGDVAAAGADTPAFAITAVTPAEGPTGGMNEVQLQGFGLEAVSTVYFGESPAVATEAVDAWTVRAIAPPRPPGFVDVTARIVDAEGVVHETALPVAYRYKAAMAVTAVAPDAGDVEGGTLVTVSGYGFGPDTAFLFGDRLAVAPLVLDEHTATMHSPPGAVGRVDVVAASPDGAATLVQAFAYRQAPRIDGVEPAVVPLQGGVVRLLGVGLVGDAAAVSVLQGSATTLATIKASAADASWLDVALPARKDGGTFDLRYSRPGATVTRVDAVTYASFIDPALGTPQKNAIVAVAPASLPANLAGDVDLQLVGPIAAAVGGAVAVKVGGADVAVLFSDIGTWPGPQPGATVRVRVPALPPPAATTNQGVLVQIGGQEAFLAGGLQRTAAAPRLVAVAPWRLDPAGGSALTLHVDPGALGPKAKVLGVRVGALFASNLGGGAQVQGLDGAALTVVTAKAPPGSPGPALVTVVFAEASASLAGAVVYGGAPALAAVLPASGSRAGHTLVKIVGGGLDRLDRLFFGVADATAIDVVHPGLALARTPAGEVGPVAVEGWFDDGGQKAVSTLPGGFTYYDPQAGHAGSWGGPIQGALDVTVVRANLDKGPIAEALVVVEQPGKPTRTALTDARGQATISELDLHGPLQVSVARQGYTAASMVAVDSRHLTFRLTQYVSPPPDLGAGAGEGEEKEDPFPDGAIEGVVLNAAKYTAIPVSSCAGQPPVAGNCAPCQNDLDCPGALTCELQLDPLAGFGLSAQPLSDPATATMARACAAPCGAGEAPCPAGFGCRAAGFDAAGGGARLRCMPLAGEPQTRCRTSTPGIFGGNPQPGPKADAAADGSFRIEARLGDVAVACTVGYLPKHSLAGAAPGSTSLNDGFVPLAMGLARSVSVAPGQTTQGVKVVIDTPMKRTIDLHLQGLPMGMDVVGDERFATAVLELGAEGYLPIADVLTRVHTDRLRLTRQPSGFSGVNADVRWTFYAGLSQPGGGSPLTIAIAEALAPEAADFVAQWKEGAAAPGQGAALAQPLRAVASDGQQVIAVGDGGAIAVWGGASFTLQGSPTSRDLGAVWLDPLGSGVGFAGGADGVLLRRDPVAGWLATLSPTPTPTPLQPDDMDTIVAIAGLHEHDLWLADAGNRIWHRGPQGYTLHLSPLAPAALPASSWPPPPPSPRLRALQRLGDGALVAAGDDGTLAIATPPSGGGPLSWQKLPVMRPGALHAVFGVSQQDLWAVGDSGVLLHVVDGKVFELSSGTFEPLFAITPTDAGLTAVGGGGTFVRVGLDGGVKAVKAPDVAADLHAVVAVEGAVLGLGTPALRLGPFLELPVFDVPSWGAPLGAEVAWHTAGGTTPTLNMLRIATADYTTRWEVFLRGDETSVQLPDFQALGGFSPVPPGSLRLRLWRIYAPGLTIDAFQSKQLSVWEWVSYAYAIHLTELPANIGPPPIAVPAPALPPTPGLPPAPGAPP